MSKLLSPAGNMQALDAAIAAGADEVYLGGNIMNARIGAKNFDSESLVKAGELCRKNGVAICYTLNTLITDREMNEAMQLVDFLQSEVRPYAYIVQDLGLAAELKRKYPSAVLHASTQCAFHSSAAVPFLKRLGFERMVIAREATKQDIISVCKTGIETEIFIHGALCVSQSGGCLMSSFIGGRSGNRGQCAQPCRLDYRHKMRYPLSLKDNCLAEYIPEILDMGVTALKIEGRMKSPEYVYTVTSIYRRLIDERRPATKKELAMLEAAFSRDGFTSAYFTGRLSAEMFGTRDNSLKNTYIQRQRQTFERQINVPRETFIDIPERSAEKCIPANRQKGYVLRFAGAVKRGFEELCDNAARVDIPIWALGYLPTSPEKISAVLPRTIWFEDESSIKRLLAEAKSKGITQVTVSNPSHLAYTDGFFVHGDMFFNLTESKTAEIYSAFNLSSVAVSSEINPKGLEFLPMAYEYCVYGRLPLMHTAACMIKNLGNDCKKHGCNAILTDRTGAKFPIIREYGHRNVIYNSVPIDLTDKAKQLRRQGIVLYTFYLTDETPEQVSAAIDRMHTGKRPAGKYTRGYMQG